jgi:hypothetical protein
LQQNKGVDLQHYRWLPDAVVQCDYLPQTKLLAPVHLERQDMVDVAQAAVMMAMGEATEVCHQEGVEQN